MNQSYSWSVASDCCSIPSLAIVGAHDEVCAIWVSCPLVVKLRIAVPICTKGDNYSLRGLRETHVLPMRKRRADKPNRSTILTDDGTRRCAEQVQNIKYAVLGTMSNWFGEVVHVIGRVTYHN